MGNLKVKIVVHGSSEAVLLTLAGFFLVQWSNHLIAPFVARVSLGPFIDRVCSQYECFLYTYCYKNPSGNEENFVFLIQFNFEVTIGKEVQ